MEEAKWKSLNIPVEQIGMKVSLAQHNKDYSMDVQ